MADNYVTIRVRATDTAKPELDSLRADLDELGSKVDSAKVDINDEDAKRKLLEINAALAELNKRVANPRIDTAGAARAEARIEKLKSDFEKLTRDAGDLDRLASKAGPTGLLGRLLAGTSGGLDSAGGGIGKLLSAAPGGPAGLAGIGVGLAALLAEADALASGFAAAGAGLGAFAVLAIPAFDKVKGAIHDTHKQLMKLTPSERGAVEGIRGLEHAFGRMSKAFEPQAFKVFNDALKIANKLLPDLKPFADTAAKALDGLLKQAGKFVESKGFKDWMKQFHGLEGGSLHAIGEGIGHLITNIGKLFTIMSKKDVVNGLNIAFSLLDGAIIGLQFAIRIIMRAWDQLTTKFDAGRRELAVTGHDIAHTFDMVRHDVAAAMDWVKHRISEDIDHMRTDLVHWAQDVGQATSRVVSWFRGLPGRVMSALASLPGKLFSFGKHIISMLASGIRSAIGDVTGAIGSIASEITSHLPMSPAKKGPLSGRGDPRLGGMRIAEMLAQGLTEGSGAVDAAANRLTGGARFGGGRGGGQGQLQVVLEFHPPAGAAVLGSEFWTAFANGIRIRGGSPGIVTRKVKF